MKGCFRNVDSMRKQKGAVTESHTESQQVKTQIFNTLIINHLNFLL